MPTRAEKVPLWAPPLMAVHFLTRIPVPFVARLTAAQAQVALVRATGWLPIAGTLIGCATAATFYAATLWWSPIVAALMALAVEAVLTGAFHEDAVADFCDAFGGSASGDEARRILKDSRIGTYGTLALILLVGLRATAMATLAPEMAVLVIVCAAGLGRLVAVMLMVLLPPPPAGRGVAKDIGTVPPRAAMTAVVTALPALVIAALIVPAALMATIAACALLLLWLRGFLRRRIGGSTGDCLGFAAYLGQLFLLLFAAAG